MTRVLQLTLLFFVCFSILEIRVVMDILQPFLSYFALKPAYSITNYQNNEGNRQTNISGATIRGTTNDLSNTAAHANMTGANVGERDWHLVYVNRTEKDNGKHNESNQDSVSRSSKYEDISQVRGTSPKAKHTQRYYIFPLRFDYNGPNVYYSTFRRGVFFALYYNRTVVENWFRTHWSSPAARSTRFLNETFDIEKLNEIVDVATVAEFKRDCNSTIDVLLMHPFIRTNLELFVSKYAKVKEKLEKRYKIILPDFSAIPQSKQSANALFTNPPKTRCLGFLSTRWEPPRVLKLFRKVDSHLERPALIKKIADDVEKKICDGDPFVALHWRNRSGEICGRDNKPCDNIDRIDAVNLTAQSLAIDIRNFMENRSISCIYVAMPPFARRMVAILRKAGISRVKTLSDISDKNYPDIVKVHDDGYMVSILEQEICSRAKVFLATQHSSWSVSAVRYGIHTDQEVIQLEEFVTWKADGVSLK
ncbi:uncharacterized protein LOC100377725 [Saccoglossus kowalevskii]